MALADRTIVPGRIGRGYRIDEIRDELPDDDVEHLDRWLADENVASKRIAAELVDEGFPVSPGAVATYRRNVLRVPV